jgi:hypothetical protein
MTDRGWITVSADDKCGFTAAGKDAYEQIGLLLQESVGRWTKGISAEEYNVLLSVLRRIIEI